MAYEPSQADFEKYTSKSLRKQPESNGYEPSQADFERYTAKKKPQLKIAEFPNMGIIPKPAERQAAARNLREVGKGAAQSFINTPEEAANVVGGHLYNKFNFAPKTEAAKLGGEVGDIASYFLPGGTVKAGLKGASLIPKAARAIEAASQGLKAKPITNYLLNMGKNAGEAALFQAEKNPKSTGIDVAKAAGIGGGFPAAINAVTASNPLISTLAKLGIGGAVGYQQGGVPGALEGAAAGVAIPKALTELGLGAKPVSSEFLTEAPNAMAESRMAAGNRLGTPLRPSEAFNSPGMARNEGMISRTETGGQEMAAQGQQRLEQQKNAINRLLDTIYKPGKRSDNAIKNLYGRAYQENISQNALHDLAEDPVISHAMQKINNDPVFTKDLKDVGPNSLAYLDQVKRVIDDMQQSAIKAGENNRARIYGQSGKNLVKELDAVSSDYKKARIAAQKKIVRNDIEDELKKKSLTGINFFNKFLQNDKKYEELLGSLKNSPKAQKQVKDMKLAWEHLIGTETPRAAAGSSARSMSTAREGFSSFWNMYKDTIGAPRDVERAKFIHDPKWWDKFDEVMKYKDKVQKREELGNLIARGISGVSLEAAKPKGTIEFVDKDNK